MKLKIFAYLIAAAALAICSPPAVAALYEWPGAAPCDNTLQACIDATADGDTISIVTDAVIDESLYLTDRSLSLRAGNGYQPRLAAYQGIIAESTSGVGNLSLHLQGLHLLRGEVYFNYHGSGTASLEIRDMEANQIEVIATDGVLNATIYNNRIVSEPSAGFVLGYLWMINSGAELNADVFFNHVSSTTNDELAQDRSILVDVRSGGTGEINLLGNEVRGNYANGAMTVLEGRLDSPPGNVEVNLFSNVVICPRSGSGGSSQGLGIDIEVSEGAIDAEVVNNTVSGCEAGIAASQYGTNASPGTINGSIDNNLLVVNNIGLELDQIVATAMTNDYNLINAPTTASTGVTLGSHTITAPAEIIAPAIPRLKSSSPAIGAADSSSLVIGLALHGMPLLDADGLRRFKGPGGNPEIGAYEYGDDIFLHNVHTVAGNYSYIPSSTTNNHPDLELFLTRSFDGGDAGSGVANDHPVGVEYLGSQWSLLLLDDANLPQNALFNVFVPAEGGGVFRHGAHAGNISGWTTELDDPSVNDQPDRIVLVIQNMDAGVGPQNPHPLGVLYSAFGGGPGSWSIVSMDLETGGQMPVGAGFNVYAQAPSPNAFRATQGSDDYLLYLDHPLLNNTRCALMSVTRIWPGRDITGYFDVFYEETTGRWAIFAYGGLILADEQFNVVVNPAQVELCRDVIFADGFE